MNGRRREIVEQEQAPVEGLRYRKKLKARMAVERAALELVIERGYDGVTVEDICARAEISKKTFFNYFSSKAMAITGRTEPFPEPEQLAVILEERAEECYVDVLTDVVGARLVTEPDDDLARLRREALEAMPQLFFQNRREVPEMQRSMARGLHAYLERHPEKRLLSDRPLRDEVLVASSSAIGLARTRSMLHVSGNCEPTASDIRHLVMTYLAAGEQAEGPSAEISS